jgi:hypothetical protein
VVVVNDTRHVNIKLNQLKVVQKQIYKQHNHVMFIVVQLMENLHLGQNGQHVQKNVVQEYKDEIVHVPVQRHHAKAVIVKVLEMI